MNETALTTPVRQATVGQIKDILCVLAQGIPSELAFEVASGVIGNKSVLLDHVRKFFPEQRDVHNPRKQWERFYQKALGLTVDLSSVVIPPKREGFARLLIIAKGVTMNQVFDLCHRHFNGKCWRYCDDLDSSVTNKDRDPKNGTYAVWVRDRVEADEELKNLSGDDLVSREIKGITLLERMVFELKYFLETGKHLDIKNVTLCNGSRYPDGYIPRAFWCGVGFRIGYRYRGDRDPRVRSREAVSL